MIISLKPHLIELNANILEYYTGLYKREEKEQKTNRYRHRVPSFNLKRNG